MLEPLSSKLALGAVVVGIIVLGIGLTDVAQEQGALPEPAVLTAQDFARQPPANRHVRLLGATVELAKSVRKPVSRGRGGPSWEEVYVPLTRPTREGRAQLVAIAWMNASKLDAFRAAAADGAIQGMRLRTFFALDAKLVRPWAGTFPAEEIAGAPLLDFARKPAGIIPALILATLGAAASLFGSLWLWRSRN